MEHGSLRAHVHLQAPGIFQGNIEQPCSFQLQVACSLFQDDASVHFWEETAVGNPFRGQFIARREGTVGWLKKHGSQGVKNGNPFQYSCLENPIGGGAWWAAVHGVAKSPTRLSDFTLTFHFHALEKKMATHSCVLAWRIPGTVEPGELPSMGSHRVGYD